jgi:hypothetical protein
MADKENITLRAIRANWPILIVAGLGMFAAVQLWITQQDHAAKLAGVDEILSREAFVSYEVWKNNIEWRINLLTGQTGCQACVLGQPK